MLSNEEKQIIDCIVRSHLTKFADGFGKRHIKDHKNPEGTINLKKQNVFMSKLPGELIYYSALVRSFDSSFGTILEKIALEIGQNKYKVSREVRGKIDSRQLDHIRDILTNYKNRKFVPEVSHYSDYNTPSFSLQDAHHASDHLLFDEEENTYHIIELKSGGDLDNKKAKAEKDALLEQYFILKNSNPNVNIKLHFATAYNKFGEEQRWTNPNVETFFSRDELLIGKDFWNFICKDEEGFKTVISSYEKNIHIIAQVLEEIREVYAI